MNAKRHAWSPPNRLLHKTERECADCGLIKVTRHEGDAHWTEWWIDGERFASDRTPQCPPTCPPAFPAAAGTDPDQPIPDAAKEAA